ncbi:MAG: hypothetical protein ACLQBX_11255 [Candidatus Limnocylindrales bacterium]
MSGSGLPRDPFTTARSCRGHLRETMKPLPSLTRRDTEPPAGAYPVTITVPVMEGWMAQWYA